MYINDQITSVQSCRPPPPLLTNPQFRHRIRVLRRHRHRYWLTRLAAPLGTDVAAGAAAPPTLFTGRKIGMGALRLYLP
jgi:hypothetical protein